MVQRTQEGEVMFVLKSTYSELLRRHNGFLKQSREILAQFSDLKTKWNDLVGKINARGGEAFLNAPEKHQFTDAELRTLISLCHPDKHAGNPAAEEMTKKLNALRND